MENIKVDNIPFEYVVDKELRTIKIWANGIECSVKVEPGNPPVIESYYVRNAAFSQELHAAIGKAIDQLSRENFGIR